MNGREPWESCVPCLAYATRRRSVLSPAMAVAAIKNGESSAEIVDRYMGGVHARHLAGGSL